jgi:hypothetical protein
VVWLICSPRNKTLKTDVQQHSHKTYFLQKLFNVSRRFYLIFWAQSFGKWCLSLSEMFLHLLYLDSIYKSKKIFAKQLCHVFHTCFLYIELSYFCVISCVNSKLLVSFKTLKYSKMLCLCLLTNIEIRIL